MDLFDLLVGTNPGSCLCLAASFADIPSASKIRSLFMATTPNSQDGFRKQLTLKLV